MLADSCVDRTTSSRLDKAKTLMFCNGTSEELAMSSDFERVPSHKDLLCLD